MHHVVQRQGKVGSAFTSVGGHSRGYGGHEAILQSFHAFFLQHGMVCPNLQACQWNCGHVHVLASNVSLRIAES